VDPPPPFFTFLVPQIDATNKPQILSRPNPFRDSVIFFSWLPPLFLPARFFPFPQVQGSPRYRSVISRFSFFGIKEIFMFFSSFSPEIIFPLPPGISFPLFARSDYIISPLRCCCDFFVRIVPFLFLLQGGDPSFSQSTPPPFFPFLTNRKQYFRYLPHNLVFCVS